MENEIKSFEDLIVWQESMQLCCDIHMALRDCKNTSLRYQAEKSSLSVPSNISEGFESQGDKVYLRYFGISKGSCGELRTQLYVIHRLNLIEKTLSLNFIARAKRISGMLQNSITSKRKSMKKRTTTEI